MLAGYFQRAFAAVEAIEERCLGERLSALAYPPALDKIVAECFIPGSRLGG